MVIEDYFRD